MSTFRRRRHKSNKTQMTPIHFLMRTAPTFWDWQYENEKQKLPKYVVTVFYTYIPIYTLLFFSHQNVKSILLQWFYDFAVLKQLPYSVNDFFPSFRLGQIVSQIRETIYVAIEKYL